MILVDTSVWIDLLNKPRRERLPEELLSRLVTCGPVVQEVFQGLRQTSSAGGFRAAFDAIPRLADPMPEAVFRDAAAIYRDGRRLGLTIRSSTDCLIAAIAIRHNAAIWHRDRDFRAIARYTPLRTLERE